MEMTPRTPEKSPELCVLIVDDEPLIRWAIGETLAHAGHTVREASAVHERVVSIDLPNTRRAGMKMPPR